MIFNPVIVGISNHGSLKENSFSFLQDFLVLNFVTLTILRLYRKLASELGWKELIWHL